jgi:WS/DGAT/MGAT family acyltransferase
MATAGDQLTALDATFLELEEADECAHMHIGAVMVLEPQPSGGAPPIDRVRVEILTRLTSLPRYRQRLSEPRTGGLRWPAWEPDDRFEIDHHVSEAGLPAPAGIEQLRVWAEEYFSVRLDRSRPLWELVVIELADGRWALVSKTHHCLVDGVGSVDAAKVLLDSERDRGPAHESIPDAEPGERSEPPEQLDAGGGLSPRALAGGLIRAAGGGLEAAGSLVNTAANVVERVADPQRLTKTLRQSEAVVEVLIRDEIVPAPPASINRPIGAHRRLAVLAVPLEDLKRIRAGLGGTVNDAVLAAAAGGLRGLLIARGEDPPARGLRAMVPVNIRPAADRLALGNQISSLFVHLPVAEADPIERYRSQLEEAEGLKSGSQAIGSRGLIDLAALAPPALHSFLARSLFASRLFNLTITNVPGPQQPLYVIGSQVTEIWPLVPLAAEHAVGLAVLSYNGTVHFCLNADHDSMPDLDLLRDAIGEEVATLLTLASEPG